MKTKNDIYLYIFLVALAIFIIGIQVGIQHGRQLQVEEMGGQYGYSIAN